MKNHQAGRNSGVDDEDGGRRFHPSFVGDGTTIGGGAVSPTKISEVHGSLSRGELFDLMMEGECFVWREGDLIGKDGRLTFDYLEANLPGDERYGGMVADDDERIFRYNTKEDGCSKEGERSGSRRAAFTFSEFRSNTRAYMQMPLLWRTSPTCNGYKGRIGDVLWNDLRSNLINFRLLSLLRVEPTVYSPFRFMQLFASHIGHLSYLHFDEQPNLFLQVNGRKRWLIFPPDADLRPYGPSSGGERRSSVDVFEEADDGLRGRGVEVLLEPGDVLFVPGYWWHHVHTVSEECISIAIWFYNDRLPLTVGPSKSSDGTYPAPLKLSREQMLGQGRYQSSRIE